jgi:S-adenosylmethionine hydrolase
VDRFGNVALGLEARCLAALCVEGRATVKAGRRRMEARCLPVFSLAKPSELVLYVNSLGFPELAVNLGSAVEALGVKPGDTLQLQPGPRKR